MRTPLARWLLGASGLLAACAESTAPPPRRGPAGPGPTPAAVPDARVAVTLQCAASVAAAAVTCRPPGDAAAGERPARGLRRVIVGGQGANVLLTGSNSTYNSTSGQFEIDVTVQNLIPQPLGTTDGTTPDATGVRIFFTSLPQATGGTGTITIDNADGTATFTAPNQPYYQYTGAALGADGILSQNETSSARRWRFTVPATVTTFGFMVFVEADVQFPDGWVDVTAAPNLLTGATTATTAVVRSFVGQPVAGATVTYSSTAPAVATVDAAGVITGVAPGTTTIVATSGALTGSATVSVCPALAVGETYATTGAGASSICLGGGAAQQEYTVIPLNANPASSVTLSATGSGIVAVTGPPTPILLPPEEGGQSPEAAHAARELGRLVAASAAGGLATAAGGGPNRPPRPRGAERMVWGASLGWDPPAARGGGGAPHEHAALGVLPPGATWAEIPSGVPAVGDTIAINVTQTCDDPADVRTGVVRSVSQKAIILADTANPAGGFTTAQYDSIALEIDTIAYAVDTANFGAPTDLDANGRIVVFYTRAVNELNPAAAALQTYGYFLARDVYPTASCPGSNVGELLYALVPDPTGAVNSNVRTVSSVRGSTVPMVVHELQHLISASRRLHINGAGEVEALWLDEAMSHIAEELAFYRTSVGLTPRSNIQLSTLTTGPNAARRVAAFNTYQNQNFSRLRSWLQRPDTSGVLRITSSLPSVSSAARGVAWAFLRYAADRLGGSEAAFWQSIVDHPDTGRAKVAALVGDPAFEAWPRDFVTALYADDVVSGISAVHTNPSWHFRSVYGGLGGFPLGTRPLTNGVTLTLTHASYGATYQRLGVPASAFATYTLRSGADPPPSTVHLLVLRTK